MQYSGYVSKHTIVSNFLEDFSQTIFLNNLLNIVSMIDYPQNLFHRHLLIKCQNVTNIGNIKMNVLSSKAYNK